MIERNEKIASSQDSRLKDLIGKMDMANMTNHPLSETQIRQIFKGDGNGEGMNTIFHQKFKRANGLPTPDLESIMGVMNRLLDEENISEDVANEIVKCQRMIEA